MADQLSLRWSFPRNKGLFKQAGHFYVGFINWTYILKRGVLESCIFLLLDAPFHFHNINIKHS